ncbi:hypothetical protein [Mycobacterium avium]|uniref:hypothetical protein n=1 Tax=Mycobacterium avium TaxID=1764 RepID=UPI00079FDC64|nr:hypothetical protein [Mycobacterium avium]
MNHSDISSAARLLRHALSPKDRPTPASQYRELLDRYQTDISFAEIVERIAEGLGLEVHQTSQLGLLISGHADSPFGVTLDNCGLPIRRSGEHRLQDRRCFGLVLLAIITYAYPNGEALIDPANRPLRAVDIERFLEQRIKRLVSLDADIGEPEGQLSESAKAWKDLPQLRVTDTGRVANNCHRWYVNNTLTFLTEQGRARREPALDDESGGEAYVLNDRFRIGLADVTEGLIAEMSAAPDDPGKT